MFSGVVKISDIDDYITPSQNCVKPIMPKETGLKTGIKTLKIDFTDEIEPQVNSINKKSPIEESYIKSDLIRLKDPKKTTAKVTLNDCLACSGCVTTAETMLIQQQSVSELIKNCSYDKNISIISISPQSITSLSYYFKLSEEETLLKLGKVFEDLNIQFMFNLNSASFLSLEESYNEFKAKAMSNGDNVDFIMSSECPGWICYAEKIIGDWVVPSLSTVKSPQQLMGRILKTVISKKFNIDIKNIYHCCVMACFDKKLESKREEFKINGFSEVDTVIATSELIELFSSMKIDFLNIPTNQNILFTLTDFLRKIKADTGECDIKSFKKGYIPVQEKLSMFYLVQENFSSNGYSEYILKRYLEEFFKDEEIKIERKTVKNSDFIELNVFKNNESKELISFAIVNGLKNIKILTKSMEKKKSKYKYIEIMACPGGCLNGGGQMKSRDEKEKSRDILKACESKIKETISIEIEIQKNFFEDLKNLKDLLENHQEIFNSRANYKTVDKSQIQNLNIKW